MPIRKLLTVLLFFLLGGCASTPPRPAVTVVVGRGGDLWRLDVSAGEFQRLTSAAPAGSAYQPAVAPAGDRVAYTFRPPLAPATPDQPLVVPQPAIYLQPLAAGQGEPLLASADPNSSADQPAWSPDGRTVYATRRAQIFDDRGAFVGAEREIIAIDVAQKSWQPLIRQAEAAAPTPDGASLTAVRTFTDTLRPQIVLLELAGRQERILLDDPRFDAIEGLAWSADSQTLFFAATQPMTATAPTPAGWFDQLGPATAAAHGTGWTIWAVDRSGANLRQLNPTRFEDPRIALFEDKALVWSFSGLWLLTPADGSAALLLAPGDISGISRVP